MSLKQPKNSQALNFIFSPAGIRNAAAKIFEQSKLGKTNFVVDESKLDSTVDFVLTVINDRYPDLDIPYHSRWRHFDVEGATSLARYQSATVGIDGLEGARVGVDLIVPSVLLDAGAGPDWVYKAPNSNVQIGRSEGLGLASIDMFLDGAFSPLENNKLMAHESVLSKLTIDDIERCFQVSPANPMVGVRGRLELVRSLGTVMKANPKLFPTGRPGDLVSYLAKRYGRTIQATDVLEIVIDGFGDIWPGRSTFEGVNLGDVWHYAPFGDGVDSLIPFHKLSQWLTYSIIETLQVNGFDVINVNELTGLAEYRNGGLFVDSGVISLRDPAQAKKLHQPSSEVIVEWRALTIHLMDMLAVKVRTKLNMNEQELPLAKVLEGGTWLAGRKLAAERRTDSSAPILLDSDGTVF